MDLPDPRIELGSPALQGDSLPTELSGKPNDFPLFSTKVLLVEMRNWLQRSVLPGKRLFYSKSWMTGSKRKLISFVADQKNKKLVWYSSVPLVQSFTKLGH